MEITTKHQLLEFDLINKYAIFFNYVDSETVLPTPQRITISDELLDKFLNSIKNF
jgi:hypothetical protein